MSEDSLRILRGVLELEARKGFSDKAVVGGIDAFWNQQRARIQGSIKDPALLKSFRSLDRRDFSYKALDINARREWVSALLDFTACIEKAVPKVVGQKAGAGGPPSQDSRPLVNEGAKAAGEKPSATILPLDHAKGVAPAVGESGLSLNSPLIRLRGVGPSIAKKFEKLGLEKLRDLIYFFPRRHIDYSQLKPISQMEIGKEQTIAGIIWEAKETMIGRRKGTEAIVGDDTGNIRVVWFNQPYLFRRLKTNERIVLSGRVNVFKGRRQMEAPQWDLVSEGENVNTGRLVPIYSLTEGLYQRQVRNIIGSVVRQYSRVVPEFLPEELKQRQKLMDLPQALLQAHLPDSKELQDRARRRLAFDELLLFQLGVLGRKYSWQEEETAPVLRMEKTLLDAFLSSLSFRLTAAQARALSEIMRDMESPRPMCRMLQGDVGSGKTVLAAAALLTAACSAPEAHQAIMMAPTEILAEQHFQTLGKLFEGKTHEAFISEHIKSIGGWGSCGREGLTLALLTGSVSKKEKAKVYEMAREGHLDIMVGTHAVIQEGLSLKSLGLAIIDEQHRFGVEQRSSLRQKGFNPHLLVMTATPIPRTLALTFFGDLDLSVLDEMPPGRKPVKTKWLNPEDRDKAYAFIQKKIGEGQQAFVICPRIEESDNIDAEGVSQADSSRREIRAAIAEYERLSRDIFPEIRLGLLHGKMPAAEKESVMRSFKNGEVKILVSTSVVEVGIDVPQATVMLVEGAENFGLSQLHQFRGRIGRGKEQSYCLLLSDSVSPEAQERLSIIERVHDGFVLAEEDLKIRGPGEFFGTRQSGMPDLTMAKLSDVALLDKARQEALEIFKVDPQLTMQEHKPLAQRVKELWRVEGELS